MALISSSNTFRSPLADKISEWLVCSETMNILREEETVDLPEWCQCPVSGEVMEDPVIVDAACLHTVNRSTFQQWAKSTCPICLSPVRSSTMSPNGPLREAIHHFFGSSHNRAYHKTSLKKWHAYQSLLGIRGCDIHTDQRMKDGEYCLRCRRREFVDELDGFETIVQLMKQNMEHKMVQQQGCESLAKLLAKQNDESKRKMVEGGDLVRFILTTMKRHPSVASIQYQGFRTLHLLPFWNQAHAKSIVESGGIRTLTLTMKMHECHGGIQRYACWFLYGLCTHFKGSLAQVAAEGAATAAEEALQRHQNDSDVQFEAKRFVQFLHDEQHASPWVRIFGL